VPLFLRLRHEIEVTGTFKHKKVELREEGFDTARIADDLYFNDPQEGRFRKLDSRSPDEIEAGQIRL
jgi:fatty-acyl-CoA synthase